MGDDTFQCVTVDLLAFTLSPFPGDAAFPSAPQRDIANQIIKALSKHGFLSVRNFGIEKHCEAVSDLFDSSKRLFDGSIEEKNRKLQNIDHANANVGYIGPDAEVLSHARGMDTEWKESFNFSFGSTRIHKQDLSCCPEKFETHAHHFWNTITSVAIPVMLRAFSVALGIEYNVLAEMMDNGNNSIFRLLHYYPLEQNEGNKDDVIIRAGEHTDFGFFTLLFTDGPGLQSKPVQGGEFSNSNDHNREWYDVPMPDSQCEALVNIGALFARLSNDWWPAAAHRVVTKMNDARYYSRSRYSIACFIEPKESAIIAPLQHLCASGSKFEPITAGVYIQRKIMALPPKKTA